MRSDGSFTLEEPDAAASQLGVTPHTVNRHNVFFAFVRMSIEQVFLEPGEIHHQGDLGRSRRGRSCLGESSG